MSDIGERIKEIRGKETQGEFAERYSVHKNTLLRWEKGERQPDIQFLQTLIRDFNLSPEWLLMGEGDKSAPAVLPGEPQTVATIHYANLIDECNELRKENKYLWPKVEALTKENGELRVEIERLKGQLALLDPK